MTFQFPWSAQAPAYIRRDFPDEALEDAGWFCELFIVGFHPIEDEELCDQTDPSQWQFMVVPSWDLKRGQSSMALRKATKRWPLVPLAELKAVVEIKLGETAAAKQRLKPHPDGKVPVAISTRCRMPYIIVGRTARKLSIPREHLFERRCGLARKGGKQFWLFRWNGRVIWVPESDVRQLRQGQYERVRAIPEVKRRRKRKAGKQRLAEKVPFGRGYIHAAQGQTRSPGSRKSQA